MFLELHGDRSFAPNYLVLITDGRSDNRTLTWFQAIAARAQEITILAVSQYHFDSLVDIRYSIFFILLEVWPVATMHMLSFLITPVSKFVPRQMSGLG